LVARGRVALQAVQLDAMAAFTNVPAVGVRVRIRVRVRGCK
jgi:hypothetical protein